MGHMLSLAPIERERPLSSVKPGQTLGFLGPRRRCPTLDLQNLACHHPITQAAKWKSRKRQPKFATQLAIEVRCGLAWRQSRPSISYFFL